MTEFLLAATLLLNVFTQRIDLPTHCASSSDGTSHDFDFDAGGGGSGSYSGGNGGGFEHRNNHDNHGSGSRSSQTHHSSSSSFESYHYLYGGISAKGSPSGYEDSYGHGSRFLYYIKDRIKAYNDGDATSYGSQTRETIDLKSINNGRNKKIGVTEESLKHFREDIRQFEIDLSESRSKLKNFPYNEEVRIRIQDLAVAVFARAQHDYLTNLFYNPFVELFDIYGGALAYDKHYICLLKIARDLVRLASSDFAYNPFSSLYEAITGRHISTNKKLTPNEHMLSILSASAVLVGMVAALPHGPQNLKSAVMLIQELMVIFNQSPPSKDGAKKAFDTLRQSERLVGIWSGSHNRDVIAYSIKHWEKHGNDFPEFKNIFEYMDGAWNFMNNPPHGTKTKIRSNGDEVFWNIYTNKFAIRSRDKSPRTMYKIEAGVTHKYPSNQAYFDAQ